MEFILTVFAIILVSLYIVNLYYEVKLANLFKGKTETQQQIIRFLFIPAELHMFIWKKIISDKEFCRVRDAEINIITKEFALGKLNVDIDDVSEIEPVKLEGSLWQELNCNDKWLKRDGISSLYQVTWLLFSRKQIFVYQCSFNLISDFKREITEEYFYTDITSFSTGTENGGYMTFKIIVPGGNFNCAITDGDNKTEEAIQGMKSYLREKKYLK